MAGSPGVVGIDSGKGNISRAEGSAAIGVVAGLLLVALGLQMGIGLLCSGLPSAAFYRSEPDFRSLLAIVFTISTVGTGGALFWHMLALIRGRRSGWFRLPPGWQLMGVFLIYIIFGRPFSEGSLLYLFLPILLLASALPSLAAVSWFRAQQPDGITWRQGSLIFMASGFLSLGSLILGEIVLAIASLAGWPTLVAGSPGGPTLLMSLTPSPTRTISFFLAITFITELLKPLIFLPWLKALTRKEAFLIGAIAGAGLAPVATLFYLINFGLEYWLMILSLTAVGGASYALSAGLLSLTGYYLSRSRPRAWPDGLAYGGLAGGIYLLWNAGFLFAILSLYHSVEDSSLWGFLKASLLPGVGFIGTLFLGWAFFWGGQTLVQQEGKNQEPAHRDKETFLQVDQAMAVWAAACLLGLLPLGLLGFYFFR